MSTAASVAHVPEQDPVEHLRDVVAVEREHSHVDGETRERVCELILEVDREELANTASRIVAALPPDQLASIVADWLEAQTAL